MTPSGGIGLAGDPVTFTATGTTTTATLLSCAPSNGAGDPLSHAFYDPASCPIVETSDASGSLSTFYRKGTGVTILGGN